jgi:hypothetical protein
MLMRNSDTGAFEFYDISHNAITSAGPMAVPYPTGTDASGWNVAGFGDFSGNADETDMLMFGINTNPGLEIFNISHNQVTSSAIRGGEIGKEWKIAGFGDFSSNPGETDMLMRATYGPYASDFELYDISNNKINALLPIGSFGQVGLEWTVAGFGDVSSDPGESDMLMRNSNTGAFEVYDISHNAITSVAAMGQVGLEWTVAGFGDFSSNPGESDMLMRNSNTGAFEVYDIKAYHQWYAFFASGHRAALDPGSRRKHMASRKKTL